MNASIINDAIRRRLAKVIIGIASPQLTPAGIGEAPVAAFADLSTNAA